MSKKILYLLIIFSIFILTKSEEELENDSNYDYDYDDGYSNNYFKESLKQYLIDKNLFESEEPVHPDQMKKIFLEVITEGEAESSTEYFGGIFNELADYFVNSYYVNKKEIKGKEIYDLIDINQISERFEQMMGDNPYYNGMNSDIVDDDENNDYDSRDDVGEATPDV